MARAHVDARDGLTGETLLGALLGAGVSVEAVDTAVASLGVGAVRLAIAWVDREGDPACVARVRAPEGTPQLPGWPRVRRLLEFAAVPDPVRDHAVAAMELLVRTEAEVAGVAVDDLDLQPVGTLDTLSVIVATCAAVHELGVDGVDAGPVGVGSGTVHGALGAMEVPAPAVRELLSGFEVVQHPVAAELTDAVGAALLATIAEPGAVDPPRTPDRVGLGTGSRVTGHAPVVRVRIA